MNAFAFCFFVAAGIAASHAELDGEVKFEIQDGAEVNGDAAEELVRREFGMSQVEFSEPQGEVAAQELNAPQGDFGVPNVGSVGAQQAFGRGQIRGRHLFNRFQGRHPFGGRFGGRKFNGRPGRPQFLGGFRHPYQPQVTQNEQLQPEIQTETQVETEAEAEVEAEAQAETEAQSQAQAQAQTQAQAQAQVEAHTEEEAEEESLAVAEEDNQAMEEAKEETLEEPAEEMQSVKEAEEEGLEAGAELEAETQAKHTVTFTV